MKSENPMQFKFKKSASCTIFELSSESKSSSTFVSAQKTSARRMENRQPMRMNMVQVKIDWMSLPNVKNGTVLGNYNFLLKFQSFGSTSIVHTEEPSNPQTPEIMLFSSKDQDNPKAGLKHWLKENDKRRKPETIKSAKVCESQMQIPERKPKEKSTRKEMVVHIPR